MVEPSSDLPAHLTDPSRDPSTRFPAQLVRPAPGTSTIRPDISTTSPQRLDALTGHPRSALVPASTIHPDISMSDTDISMGSPRALDGGATPP